MTKISTFAVAGMAAFLLGCNATAPKIGDENAKTVATGAAGGASSGNANSQLERCSASMGTLAVVEDQQSGVVSHDAKPQPEIYRTGIAHAHSAVQLLCSVFRRGAAMRNMQQERSLQQSGELRNNSNFGKGQMVSADFSMNPSITFSQKGTGCWCRTRKVGGGLLGAAAGGGGGMGFHHVGAGRQPFRRSVVCR